MGDAERRELTALRHGVERRNRVWMVETGVFPNMFVEFDTRADLAGARQI